MARNRGIYTLLFYIVFSIILVSKALAEGEGATAVAQLESVFGNPEDFVALVEEMVKERSDQLIGLLVAAAGFGYVIKIFL